MKVGPRNRRRGDLERGTRRKRGLLILALLFANAYLLLAFFFGDKGMINHIRIRQTYRTLRGEIASIREENGRLHARIDALRSDPRTIEKLARERLGMVREGETVYDFSPPAR